MSVERSVEIFFGVMVIASLLLTKFVHPGFFWMTLLIGVNVIQQAITGICPAAWAIKKMGLPSERELGARYGACPEN